MENKEEKIAMILAAGLGTRLKPFTDFHPKALMKYKEKALLQIIIENLQLAGFNRIIVNIHHFGDQILEFLEENNNFGLDIIISDERDELLDTGGGISEASVHFKDSPVLIHNVDIITNLDLCSFYDFHLKNNSPLSLAVKNRETSRSLLSDSDHLLCGWKNNLNGETIITREKKELFPVAFSGIYILDPNFIDTFKRTGPFPVMPEFLRLAKEHDIYLYSHNADSWKDMGKIESFQD